MTKNRNSGLFFFVCVWVLPLLNVRYCFKLSSKLCANLRKHNEPNLKKWWKFGTPFFFFFFTKTWLCHSLDIMNGQLSSCTKSEKTNDPILKKLSYGRAGGRADRWTRVISWEAVRLTSSVQYTQKM